MHLPNVASHFVDKKSVDKNRLSNIDGKAQCDGIRGVAWEWKMAWHFKWFHLRVEMTVWCIINISVEVFSTYQAFWMSYPRAGGIYNYFQNILGVLWGFLPVGHVKKNSTERRSSCSDAWNTIFLGCSQCEGAVVSHFKLIIDACAP